MNAQELFKRDGTPAGVYYCEACRRVHRIESEANNCCPPPVCKRCGCEVNTGNTHGPWECKACRELREAELLQSQYDAATKLTPQCYEGWVHDPHHGGYDGRYYESVQSMLDETDEIPPWVFACTDHEPYRVNTGDVTEMMFSDCFDDAADQASGLTELDAALAAFWEANRGVLTYAPDYSRVIVLGVRVARQPQEARDGE